MVVPEDAGDGPREYGVRGLSFDPMFAVLLEVIVPTGWVVLELLLQDAEKNPGCLSQ